MTVFVDSSGILALLDRDDSAHAGVVEAFALGRSEALLTHAYVIVETLAVARRRYGPAVAADLIDRVIPALEVTPVDAEQVRVVIRLTLTAPGCGMGEILAGEVADKLLALPRVAEVTVDFVFDPPWDRSRMSEAAQLTLGL